MQTSPQARIGLLVIGDEILSGRREDKHFRHCRSFFSERGLDIAWLYYLGDEESLLVEHFRAIRQKAEICMCFGGIGATPDDRTRQAMATAHDLPLQRHPEAVRLIEAQFGAAAYPNRILMADLPRDAELIPNDYNNIPGFSIGEINCLPGFPEMAWPMLHWLMQHRYGHLPRQIDSFAGLIVRGVRESELIGLLETAQAQFPGVKLSSLPHFPHDGVWQIELGARGEAEQVGQLMALLRAELQSRRYDTQELNPAFPAR